MAELNSLNPEQRKAVHRIDGPVLILAGAGTGKTNTITHRVAHMVDQGISPENILAVTFTNKAAREMQKRVTKLIPIAIGLLFFARLIPSYAWLIRYPIAILMGIGAGLAIPNVMQADIFRQVHGTLTPFSQIHAGTLSGPEIFGAILMLIGVISTLTYFFFSIEHRGVVGGVSKVGILFLMVGFGSAFGNTVMGRVSLLIQRVEFLLQDWLHFI